MKGEDLDTLLSLTQNSIHRKEHMTECNLFEYIFKDIITGLRLAWIIAPSQVIRNLQ